MTSEVSEVGLVQLLHLPPGQAKVEQVVPGRQGGLTVVVMGAVVALIGVFLGLTRPDAGLAWTGVALTGLGTLEILVGMVLVPLGRRDRQPPARVEPEDSPPAAGPPPGQGRSRISRSSRKSVIV
jgi:hypothetical protein